MKDAQRFACLRRLAMANLVQTISVASLYTNTQILFIDYELGGARARALWATGNISVKHTEAIGNYDRNVMVISDRTSRSPQCSARQGRRNATYCG